MFVMAVKDESGNWQEIKGLTFKDNKEVIAFKDTFLSDRQAQVMLSYSDDQTRQLIDDNNQRFGDIPNLDGQYGVTDRASVRQARALLNCGLHWRSTPQGSNFWVSVMDLLQRMGNGQETVRNPIPRSTD